MMNPGQIFKEEKNKGKWRISSYLLGQWDWVLENQSDFFLKCI